MIETRNGSDEVIKQHVWGTQYVDESIQIGINTNPGEDDDGGEAGTQDNCDTFYWTAQDANYNVIGLFDSDGDLKERYEYTPYGQRTVFRSPGSDDTLAMAPTLESRRVEVGGVDQPYGLCDIGHQGLIHDKEFALIYVRARYLQPILMRMMSWDKEGYIEGMNLYEYCRSNPVDRVDWMGLASKKRSFPEFEKDFANRPENKGRSRSWIRKKAIDEYINSSKKKSTTQPKKAPARGRDNDTLPTIEIVKTHPVSLGKVDIDKGISDKAHEIERSVTKAFAKEEGMTATLDDGKVTVGDDKKNRAWGTSGFMYGWIIDASIIEKNGTCTCDFKKTKYKFMAYKAYSTNAGGGATYIDRWGHIDKSGNKVAIVPGSTEVHEGWHTDGIPDAEYDRARGWGYILVPRPGYAGQASMLRDGKEYVYDERVQKYHLSAVPGTGAMQRFKKLVKKNIPTGYTSRKERISWCETEAKTILDKYFLSDDAVKKIQKAGYFHGRNGNNEVYSEIRHIEKSHYRRRGRIIVD